MRGALVLIFLVVVFAPGASLEGQLFRWLAFGDSITKGHYDFDELGGYPGRLSDLLGCSPGVCEVFNAGKGGEKTYQGVSRIDSVLDEEGPFDVMMLMEGTNDIFVESSVESAISNLGTIALKARIRGIDTVHASIIWYHPEGDFGTTKDDEVEALRDGAEGLSNTHIRYFVDIWDVLCPDSHPDVHGHDQTECFDRHYSDVPDGDDRGHPIGSGYKMMAEAFRDGLLSVPVPGVVSPVSPVGTSYEGRPMFIWDREFPVGATWYRLIVEGDAGVEVDKWIKAAYTCGASTCFHTLTSTEALTNGDYTWSVQGRNPAGRGSFSPDTSITILLEGIFADGFESGDTGSWWVQ